MPQIIKIEIFVLLFCLIFADRHGAICFRISTTVPELWAFEGNYFSTCEAEKTTSFPYTNPPGFSERRNRPNMWQMLKEVMMLLLVTPYHVVEARWNLHALAPQHQLSCRSSVPLLWQPHPFHVSFSQKTLSAWARNCLSVWRRIVRIHLRFNLKISKIQISNCFRAILQNISLQYMGGLCIYGHISANMYTSWCAC